MRVCVGACVRACARACVRVRVRVTDIKTNSAKCNMFQFQFSLFPAHNNISYYNDNVYIMCRKRGGQKAVLMNVHPLTITSKL